MFRAEHALKKGRLDKAKTHLNAAGQLGDDPDVLLGLAKLAFQEERARGSKANLDRVSKQLDAALTRRQHYPKARAYVGDVQLTLGRLDEAVKNYRAAERDYWKENRSVHERAAFYDYVIDRLDRAAPARLRRRAKALAQQWRTKKKKYVDAVAAVVSGK